MNQEYKPEITLPSLNFSAFLEKIIIGGIIFVLALPLLGDYGNVLFPLGRDIIFKIAVEFLIILLLLRIVFEKLGFHWSLVIGHWDFKKTLSPITFSLLAFWLVMSLSAIKSVQPEFSIWGNIYKNQGLMTWAHYLLFFFLLISFLKDKKQWRFLIYAAVLVSSIVSLIAVWQMLSNDLANRATSTLNNPNYLAAYLILFIPLTLALFIKKKSYLLGSTLLLQSLALILTQTRGGYLGVIASAFVFLFLYLSTKKSRIFLTLSSLVALLVYLSIVFTPFGQSFQEKLPDFTNRFLSYQSIKASSGPRLEAWQAGWKGMLERPLLGYGPENFFVPFDKFYDGSGDNQGSLAREGSLWETWFDKAHNFIFDIGATTGFLGLLAYIGIFASAIWILLRRIKMYGVSPRTSIIYIGLISTFVGYLAQNLLGFDTLVPTMYLVFFLAFTNFMSSTHGQSPKISLPTGDLPQGDNNQKGGNIGHWGIGHSLVIGIWSLGFIFLVFLFIASFKMHTNILRANYNLNLAESLAQKGKIEQAFSAYEKGLGYNAPPINPNLRRRYAVISLAYYDAVKKHCDVNPSGSDPDGLDCEKLYKDSEKYLNRALVLQKENAATEWPRFTRNYIYAAQISHILGNYEESDEFFKKAIELSPNRKSINTEWERLIKERKENSRNIQQKHPRAG